MKMKIVRGSSLSIPVAIVLISLPILVLVCAGPPSLSYRVLEIVNTKNGDQVFRTQVWVGDDFSLEYVHSVQRSRVKDTFTIDRRHRIVLMETTFSDHGAGLPYKSHQGGTFSILNDGKFYISDMNVVLPEILLRTGVEYDNAFESKNRRINLSRRCGDALLTIRIQKHSVFKRLFRKIV